MIDLNDEDFKRLVNSDIREQIRPHQAKELRQPENLQRWYDALLEMKVATESQLSHDRADRSKNYAAFVRGNLTDVAYAEYVAERDSWRATVLHFKAGIERKIAEAKRLRCQHPIDERVRKLKTAIEEHRLALQDSDDYGSVDEDLWGALDE